jgi:hypothetical protein
MSHKIFLFLSIAILFLFFNHLNAQTNKFELGAEVSPSITFIKGSSFMEDFYDPTFGFSGGFSFQYNIDKRIALRTNLTYERKGGINRNNFYYDVNLIKNSSINFNFDYLTLPILVRFSFGKRVKYFINTGPYFGYLLSQTFVTKGDNFNTFTNDYTAATNKFDVGISFGTGIQYPIKEKIYLSSEIRGNLGLYNTIPSGDTKVNSVNLLLGIAYRL